MTIENPNIEDTTNESQIVQGQTSTSEQQVAARFSSATNAVPGQGKKAAARGGKYAEFINKVGFRPVEPPVAEVTLGKSKISFASGFYLLSGVTGGGKSITAASIAIVAKSQGVPSKYYYCFEARAPQYTENKDRNPFLPDDTSRSSNDLALTGFIDRLSGDLPKLGTSSSKPGLVVIDSIALPLRAYRSTERANQATMKGGLQPMDIAFVVEVERIALVHNVAIIGVINEDLVPFAAQLEGMAEGIITIHSAGAFSVRNRVDRMVHEVTLEHDAKDAGAAFLHYPPQSPSSYEIFGFGG